MTKYFLISVAAIGILFYAQNANASDARALVTETAQRHGVSPALANAVAHVESGHRCGAVGRAGEVGPMQIKPATARGVGVRVARGGSCAAMVEASMRYLKMAIARGGQSCAGISLYNRGVYARPVCTRYGRKVLAAMGR